MENLIEAAAKAAWKRDYPNGGSLYASYESTDWKNKELYRNEVKPIVDALKAACPIEIVIEKDACPHALKKLDEMCIKQKRHSVKWALLHPQHAGFPVIFKTKKEADAAKKHSQYIVCRVVVIPLYGNLYAKG